MISPAVERSRGDVAILIVEDDEATARSLARVIAEMGYWVMGTARTAEETLAAANRHRPDLVLVDVHIEGRDDGITAAAA